MFQGDYKKKKKKKINGSRIFFNHVSNFSFPDMEIHSIYLHSQLSSTTYNSRTFKTPATQHDVLSVLSYS